VISSRDFIEILTVAHMVNKFSGFYRTLSLSRKLFNGASPEPVKSNPHHLTLFAEDLL
jgi:hypothetical protein